MSMLMVLRELFRKIKSAGITNTCIIFLTDQIELSDYHAVSYKEANSEKREGYIESDTPTSKNIFCF